MWNHNLLFACSGILIMMVIDVGQAQQAPRYFAPQFSNVSYRTNVCDRFLAYANGKLNIADALSGLKLAVGVVDHNDDFYFNLNRNNLTINEQAPGIFVVILDELARRGNFTWRDSYARILPPNLTAHPDATWTDVLVDSVERYDLSFAEWVHSTERRRRGVNFPVGWYDTSTIFIRDSRDVGVINEFNFQSWTRPLEFSLWVLFALGFIYNRLLYWVLDKIEDDGSPKQITSKEKVYRIRMVELVFDSDRSNGKRLHNMSHSLFTMVFVASLTANLATFLIRSSEPDFQYVGLDDLNSRFIPVCVRQADAVFESLSNDFETMNFQLSGGLLETYQRLLQGDCEVVAARRADFDIYQRNPSANPDCTLEWVGRPEYINFGGMATMVDMNASCTSLVGHVLDLHMREMTEFIEEAWQGYLEALSSYECPPKITLEDTRYSLTLNDIGGIFIVYAGLAVLGLFVAIFEQRMERRRVRKSIAELKAQHESQHELSLQEGNSSDDKKKNKGTFSKIDMAGNISGDGPSPGGGGGGGRTSSIAVDTDMLRRILTIDRTIAKLQYQLAGGESGVERRMSGVRLSGGSSSRRLSGSGRSSRSIVRRRSSGGDSTNNVSPTPSPRNSGSANVVRVRRPSLSELGKPRSQQNILAMG